MTPFTDARRSRLDEARIDLQSVEAQRAALLERHAALLSLIEHGERLLEAEESIQTNPGESSNGRTPDLGSGDGGSTPADASNEEPEQVNEQDADAVPSSDLSPASPGRVWRPCDCGCGTSISIGAFELRNRPDKKFFLNRSHHHVFMRSDVGKRWTSDVGKRWTMEMREAASNRQRQRWADRKDVAITPDLIQDKSPDISEPSPDSPQIGQKPVCACPMYWYKKVQRFDVHVANEAHNEACPMYRKGAHFFPIPSALGDGVDVECLWCTEKKHYGPPEGAKGISWTQHPGGTEQPKQNTPVAGQRQPTAKTEPLLTLVRERPGISQKDAAHALGISTSLVNSYATTLVGRGLVDYREVMNEGAESPANYHIELWPVVIGVPA